MELLNEIEKLLENCEYNDCCIRGDLNTDVRRDTGFVREVTRFMDRIGLVSVLEKFPIDFTHVHTDLKSFSMPDNFYVNKDFLYIIEDAGPSLCDKFVTALPSNEESEPSRSSGGKSHSGAST